MLFRNPVAGVIHPKGWSRPSGNIDFVVTQVFGCTGMSWEPPLGSCAHYHRGLDIANGRCGDPVFAAQAGTVRWAGRDPYDGAIGVIIDHGGGWGSSSWHLSSEIVYVGQRVAKGQKIGYVGSTGHSTGCHVDFTIKSGVNWAIRYWSDTNGRWEDPWKHLEQNCNVRPKALSAINIRSSAGSGSTLGPIYAHTDAALHIRRNSDNADLGLVSAWRAWGGQVTGGSYSWGGSSSNQWDLIYLGGAWRYIACLLDERSLS